MKNIAIILAGGTGTRMKLGMPKQLLKIAGRPIIEHTLDTFENNPLIDEVIVMMTPGYVDEIKPVTDKFSKVYKVLEGGETRNDTTQIALAEIDEECNVLIHDAVRPFVSDAIIKRCVEALDEYSAVDVAIPSTDTVIEVEESIIQSIPDRSRLQRGQTPQAFKLSAIKAAYEKARLDGDFKATDDCGVVVQYTPEVPVAVVMGDEGNIKVTHPLDASVADKLFQLRSAQVATLNEDERRKELKNKVLVVFGASQGIGLEIVKIASDYGAKVHGFSRELTGTNIVDTDAVKSALSSVYDKEGKIDYVVNTAGKLTMSPIDDMSIDDITEAVEVNYIAPAIIAKLSKPYLKETAGQILLFTSSSYTRGRANYSLYSSSKAAVVNLTQALAEEWSDDNIRVNCINPERTATPMRQSAFGDEDPNTLLTARTVGEASIDALLSELTSQVFDVRKV